MYLIKVRRIGRLYHIFTEFDPASEGYTGGVEKGVELDYNRDVHRWPEGTDRPSPVLARDPNNNLRYKVFKFPNQADSAGYEIVDVNTPFWALSWREFEHLFPPLEERSEEEWFDVLDETDEAARARNGRDYDPEPPVDSPVGEIARWIARRQMNTDASISRIVYLPGAAPQDEIRLIAVNDRLASANPKPFTVGTELSGRAFKLRILDVDTERFLSAQRDPKLLPDGWSLNNSVVWNRRP